MHRLAILLASGCALAGAADLTAVHSVYVMPMARGLDQYLAGRLASRGRFQIVTDPKLADAVLTDRMGETLLAQLEIISPTPKPETEEEPQEPEPTTKAEREARVAKTQQDATSSMITALGSGKGDTAAPSSTFGRSKGNIFLVDAKSRQVIWSTYDPPHSTAPADLNRTAADIVARINKDLKALEPKKK